MAFIKVPKGHTVDDVVYEVFFMETETGPRFTEWLTVHYAGGAAAHRGVSGNSNSANFCVVADMIHGGCYDYNRMYEELTKDGWKLLNLNKIGGLYEVK